MLFPARVNSRPKKKIDFFVPSNITSHYTCYCSILKAIFMPAEERSATFSRHSTLFKHPSYLKNGSSVFHTISILSSPLIITFLITFWIFSLSKDSILMILSNCLKLTRRIFFWRYFYCKLFDFLMQFINLLHHRL